MVLAGSAWCMLCHADLRTEEEKAAARAAAAAVAAVPPPMALSGTVRGRHRRGGSAVVLAPSEQPPTLSTAAEASVRSPAEGPVEPAPPVLSLGDVDVEAMLQQLAAESPDPLGGLSGQLKDRSAKFAVIAGGAVVVTMLGFLLLVFVGSVFG